MLTILQGDVIELVPFQVRQDFARVLGDRFYYDHLQEQALLKRQRKAVKRLRKQRRVA